MGGIENTMGFVGTHFILGGYMYMYYLYSKRS